MAYNRKKPEVTKSCMPNC